MALMALSGCAGNPVPSDRAAASLTLVEPLAGGQLTALQTGSLFIRVQVVTQPPLTSFASASHAEGFLYVDQGSQVLTVQGENPVDLHSGQSIFQRSLAHVHANPGDLPNHWYFIGVWPSAVRGAPPVSALIQVLYETENLPAAIVESGPYIETLRRVSVGQSGRTAAVQYGGIELLYVLSGTVSMHRTGRSAAEVAAGQGAWDTPGSAVQVYNVGTATATYLDFILTPSGHPFETELAQPV